MDVKQAARVAAEYVATMEQMTHFGKDRTEEEDFQFLDQLNFSIEGTRFDDEKDMWEIEVGFTRPWDKAKPNPLLASSPAALDRRTVKRVMISDRDGKVMSYGE